MTVIATSAAARAASKAVLALGTLVLVATGAGAADPRVERACANDYLAYCSQHDPDGPGVRQCMRAVGPNLSRQCIGALIAAGEVGGTKSVVKTAQVAKKVQVAKKTASKKSYAKLASAKSKKKQANKASAKKRYAKKPAKYVRFAERY